MPKTTETQRLAKEEKPVTSPLTSQQLDDIEQRATSRRVALSGWINCYSPVSEQTALENAEAVLEEDVPALLAEVRRLHADLADAEAEKAKLIRWHGEDEKSLATMRGTIERLRGEKREIGELAARRESELIALRGRMEQIRHLHKDSPMGPCPVCIDADGLAAGGDGLVPYPCPTGRLAGAQDCDPPWVRAAIESGTGPCGHGDYHDPHEWADRPGVWCPGHSDAATPV